MLQSFLIETEYAPHKRLALGGSSIELVGLVQLTWGLVLIGAIMFCAYTFDLFNIIIFITCTGNWMWLRRRQSRCKLIR